MPSIAGVLVEHNYHRIQAPSIMGLAHTKTLKQANNTVGNGRGNKN